MMKHVYTKLINISQIRNQSKACIIIFIIILLYILKNDDFVFQYSNYFVLVNE